jgi:hypothetical protein
MTKLQCPYGLLRVRWLLALSTVSIVLAIAYGSFLRQQGAPLLKLLKNGIVTLELPWDSERAQQLVAALGEDGIRIATLQVQLDFAFLLLYPIALSTTCALFARHVGPVLGRLGMVMAWAVLMAAPLDAIENLAILKMLGGHTAAPWPMLSTICAAAKFSLVIGALLYAAAGAVAWTLRALRVRSA